MHVAFADLLAQTVQHGLRERDWLSATDRLDQGRLFVGDEKIMHSDSQKANHFAVLQSSISPQFTVFYVSRCV
jgi:hypothetical protein